jgi:hypothetical protein
MSCGPAAIVDRAIIEGRPIRAISYLEPIGEWDSGYALFAGQPDDLSDAALVCLDCLIDAHGEILHGLEQAFRHGQWDRPSDDY